MVVGLWSGIAHAATADGVPDESTVVITPSEGVITNLIKKVKVEDVPYSIINYILGVLGVLAILAIIVSGVRYATSAGNDKQMEAAKNGLLYSITGLAIVLLAYTILATINLVLT